MVCLLVLIFSLGSGLLTLCQAGSSPATDYSDDQDMSHAGRLTLGLRYSYAERVLVSDTFEGLSTNSNPGLSVSYEQSSWSVSLFLGSTSFKTEHTSMSEGLSIGLELEADIYEFKTYYSSIRTRFSGNYYDGDGSTGPADTFVQLSYMDLHWGLFLTSELSPFMLYAGPLCSFIQGNVHAQGYAEFDFNERYWLGIAAGLSYTLEQWEAWCFSAEVRYQDNFQVIVDLTFRT